MIAPSAFPQIGTAEETILLVLGTQQSKFICRFRGLHGTGEGFTDEVLEIGLRVLVSLINNLSRRHPSLCSTADVTKGTRGFRVDQAQDGVKFSRLAPAACLVTSGARGWLSTGGWRRLVDGRTLELSQSVPNTGRHGLVVEISLSSIPQVGVGSEDHVSSREGKLSDPKKLVGVVLQE